MSTTTCLGRKYLFFFYESCGLKIFNVHIPHIILCLSLLTKIFLPVGCVWLTGWWRMWAACEWINENCDSIKQHVVEDGKILTRQHEICIWRGNFFFDDFHQRQILIFLSIVSRAFCFQSTLSSSCFDENTCEQQQKGLKFRLVNKITTSKWNSK